MNGEGVGFNILLQSKEAVTALNNLNSILNKVDGTLSAIEKNNGISSIGNKGKKAGKELNSSDGIFGAINSKLTIGNLRNIANEFSRLTSFIGSSVKKSSDYVENLNLMKVAFGENADGAKEFVDNLAGVTGLDENTLTRQLGIFRQIGNALNIDATYADKLAKNLVGMQLDISSLYNTSFERAGYALQSALTQQPRSIKALTGADVTQGTLQMDLDRLGIDRSVTDLNKAEKAILTYLSLQRQLTAANGDLARTINQPANQMKIFSEQINRASRSLGNLFLPILQAVLPWVNGLLMVFTELVSSLMSFIGIDTSSFWNSISTNANSATIDLDDLTESSEEAQKSLRGWDKLNVINTPKSSGSSSMGVDQRFLDAMGEYNSQLSEIQSKATKIRDTILEWLGFTVDENGKIIDFNANWGTVIGTLIGAFAIGGTVYKAFSFFGGLTSGILGKGGGEAAVKAGSVSGILGIVAGIVFIGGAAAITADAYKKLNGMYDESKKNTKDSADATWDLYAAYKNLIDNGEATDETFSKLSDTLALGTDTIVQQFKTLEGNKNITTDWLKTTGKITSEQQLLIDKMTYTIGLYDLLDDSIGLTKEQTEKYISTIDDTIRMYETLGLNSDTLKEKYKELTGTEWKIKVNSDTTKPTTEVEKLTSMFKNPSFNQPKVTVDADTSPAQNKLAELKKLVGATITGIAGSTGYGGNGGLYNASGVRVFANGGFVDEGQMFVAREAGAELVGNIGGKTAVANNDQIVNSVAKGVTDAIVRSGAFNSKVNSNIIVKADDDGMLKYLTFKQQELNRQFGL